LYFPEKFAAHTGRNRRVRRLPYHEIAFRVLSRYTDGVIPDDALAAMCRDAYNFSIPLEKTYDRVQVMRLGPGADGVLQGLCGQMMARMFGYFLRETGRQVTILTPPAAIRLRPWRMRFTMCRAFALLIVLFPYEEVSVSQRKLMTTLAENIRTIAIDGKFDDCQAMVKRAFADATLQHIPLSSANSINIGRLLPQSVYYFYAASRVAQPGEPVAFSVPSGNFGDMMGAVVAGQMGLPIKKLMCQ